MKIGLVIVIVLILLAIRAGREGYMPYRPDEITPPPRMYLPDPGFYPVSVYFAPAFP